MVFISTQQKVTKRFASYLHTCLSIYNVALISEKKAADLFYG